MVSKENALKAEALEKVLDSLGDGCYVFGGCVRDLIAGKEFKDIDIFFRDMNAYNTFLNKMANVGYTTKYQRTGRYVSRGAHEVRELRKKATGTSDMQIICNIDCVIADADMDGLSGSHMFPHEWDADINAISMDKTRQVSSLTGQSDQALAEMIKRIQQSVFIPLPGMTKFRKQKLLKKGYKEMSVPLPTTPEQSFFDTFKNEVAPEVAYRVTASQLVKGTKQVALLGIQAKGGSSEMVKTVSEVMNTEAGDVAIAAMLAALCMYTPALKDNPKVKRLAKEFQISGMTTGANALLDVARELLLPGLLDALKKLPDMPEETSTHARVGTAAPTQLFPETVQDEEIESAPQKRATAR